MEVQRVGKGRGETEWRVANGSRGWRMGVVKGSRESARVERGCDRVR
jgi:hypothetical protein